MSNLDDENFDDFSHNDDEELRQMIRSIQRAEKFFLHFAVCNQVSKQNELIKQIKEALPVKKIKIINFKKPITDLLGEINRTLKGKKYDAIFIQGLFYSIKSDGKGNENKLIHNLNITRDRFGKELSFPIYLWLPEYAFAKIARNAPDFFSVRSGSYYFSSTAEKITELIFQNYSSKFLKDSNLSLKDKLTRIKTLESLLAEYHGLPLEKRDKGVEGRLLFELANIYWLISNFEMAIKHFEKALIISNEGRYKSSESSILGNLGLIFKAQGEYKKSIIYFSKSLELAQEIGDSYNEGNQLGNLGVTYLMLGEFEKAIEYCQKSLKIAKEINNQNSESVNLVNLGISYNQINDYEKAIKCFEQSLLIAEELEDKKGLSHALGNLGSIYDDLSETQKAINYYEEAIKIAKEIGDRKGEGTRLGNLGIIFDRLGNYQKAVTFYEEALKIAKEIGDKNNAGIWMGNLGGLYATIGEKIKAREYLNSALKMLETIESPDADIFRQHLQILENE